jgi:uncharacterized protein (TIGR02246 family)
MRRLLIAVLLLMTGSPLSAAESCTTLDSKAVAALFDDWNFALSSLDAGQVVQRYWPNAVLLPTVSNTPRTNAAMIGDYFEHFLAKRPRGRIDTRTIQGGCNVATDVGTYTFSLMDDKGVTSEVPARYTFIYQYRDGAWKILHHHSSAMPESASAMPADAHVAIEKPSGASKTAPEPLKAKSKEKDKDVRKTASQLEKPTEKSVEKPAEKPVDSGKPEDRTPLCANLTVSPAPAKFYPPEAAKHKERGNVNLKVCADEAGAIDGTPEIVTSSGSKLLDEAAMTWARAATWVPATLNRQRVEGCTQVFVAFDAKA